AVRATQDGGPLAQIARPDARHHRVLRRRVAVVRPAPPPPVRPGWPGGHPPVPVAGPARRPRRPPRRVGRRLPPTPATVGEGGPAGHRGADRHPPRPDPGPPVPAPFGA